MIGRGVGLLVVPESIVSDFKALLAAYYEGRGEDEIFTNYCIRANSRETWID